MKHTYWMVPPVSSEPSWDPEPMPVNHTPYMEMPQPVSFQAGSQYAHMPSDAPQFTNVVPDRTDTEVTPQSRGLKVLPAWMTPKRS